MRNLRQLFQLKGTTWSLVGGVLLAGLLGGCTTPLIDVKVSVDNTCPTGGSGMRVPIDNIEAGACITPFISWSGQSAVGFWDSSTSLQIPIGSTLTCASGVKCRTTPGNCGIGKPCKSWYRPSNGQCLCDCNKPAP